MTDQALKAAVELMGGAAAMLESGAMPAPGTPYATAWASAHRTLLAALSSQASVMEEMAGPGNAMMGRIVAACAHQANLPADPETKADRQATFRAASKLADALDRARLINPTRTLGDRHDD